METNWPSSYQALQIPRMPVIGLSPMSSFMKPTVSSATIDEAFVRILAARTVESVKQLPSDHGVRAAGTAQGLITRIREQLAAGRRARAVDIVYDGVDELLLSKSFDVATIVIRAIVQNKLPLAILLSVLTVSLPWRDMLGPVRLELVEAVRLQALEEGGKAKVIAVLRGLT